MNQAPPNILLPLTAKEKAVLEFIERFLQEQGIAPSYQEIKEHFGFASFNSVQRYLQQLQQKKYIYVPGGNLKRAITVLHSSQEIQNLLSTGAASRLNKDTHTQTNKYPFPTQQEKEALSTLPVAESLSLPLLGRVAAGRPLEALHHDESVSVPAAMIRNPDKTYALQVVGNSMVEDGILDGDLIFVQRQERANNGETVVAMVQSQATVKKFYLHGSLANKEKLFVHSYPQSAAHSSRTTSSEPRVELRPANSAMSSFWYHPDEVSIQGIVVGLLRRY